jgi:hypothetical protein
MRARTGKPTWWSTGGGGGLPRAGTTPRDYPSLFGVKPRPSSRHGKSTRCSCTSGTHFSAETGRPKRCEIPRRAQTPHLSTASGRSSSGRLGRRTRDTKHPLRTPNGRAAAHERSAPATEVGAAGRSFAVPTIGVHLRRDIEFRDSDRERTACLGATSHPESAAIVGTPDNDGPGDQGKADGPAT